MTLIQIIFLSVWFVLSAIMAGVASYKRNGLFFILVIIFLFLSLIGIGSTALYLYEKNLAKKYQPKLEQYQLISTDSIYIKVKQ